MSASPSFEAAWKAIQQAVFVVNSDDDEQRDACWMGLVLLYHQAVEREQQALREEIKDLRAALEQKDRDPLMRETVLNGAGMRQFDRADAAERALDEARKERDELKIHLAAARSLRCCPNCYGQIAETGACAECIDRDNYCEAELASLRSQLQQAESSREEGWQPISTAPKDEEIQFYGPNGWDAGSWQDGEPESRESGVITDPGSEEGWYGFKGYWPGEQQPTHWRPLPPAPQPPEAP